jgi:VanZ family protein
VIEELRAAIGPYYLYIKAIHVLSAAIWGFSTAVAWAYFLKPALRAARRHPEDATLRTRRDVFMERFDKGASLEHVAFAFLLLTAVLMLWIAQVDLTRWSFITALLWLGVLIIVPMEAFDIYLSHLGGNKARVRATGDSERYEKMMDWHWKFLRLTEPVVIVLVPIMFVIAIAKPF